MSEKTILEPTSNKEANQEELDWGGGAEPMKISYGKMMMWYFLLSDAFTFSAFLITYGTLRVSSSWWPDPNFIFNAMPGLGHREVPMGFVSIMTFILILSSVFVVRAVQEGHRMNRTGVMFWMTFGILGGLAFLGCQAWEWTHLIHNGLLPTFNPYGVTPDGGTVLGEWTVENGKRVMVEGFSEGPRAFGALFFGITGFHGFHVFSGVCFNIWGFIQTANGSFHRRGHYEMIEKLGLYWHFVDLVWVFVFLAFYLL
jgi:cytochrome c oxidase subunit 3